MMTIYHSIRDPVYPDRADTVYLPSLEVLHLVYLTKTNPTTNFMADISGFDIQRIYYFAGIIRIIEDVFFITLASTSTKLT